MGNILNIIDSRNDFKKTDGQIKLQHGAFFAIDFDEHFEYKFCNLDDIDDSTNYFYVVEHGAFDVLVKEDVRVPTRYGMISKIKVRRIASLGIGNSFGERAILENTKSGMTVRATTNGVVWRIKREDVSKVLGSSKKNAVKNSLAWRKRVAREVNKHSFFRHLQQDSIKVRVINSFFPVVFKEGETVIHENELGDNFYIIDHKMKTIERFDPYGVMKWESYETYDWLDKSMKAYLKKNKMDYTYFSPEEYCPVIGLQHKEEGERAKGVTKHKDSDSDGYCGAWCLFYTEMRLKNPDLKKKELLSKITKQLKEHPKSFKSFIKTYSTFVLKMKSEIKEKINQLCGGRKTLDNLNKCENVTMNKYIVNNLI